MKTLRLWWWAISGSTRSASDPGRVNGRGLLVSASLMKIRIEHDGGTPAAPMMRENYKIDDDAEMISS
jgi:hypothetical protein